MGSCRELLKILSEKVSFSDLPKDRDDQSALLQWAYFEATALVRQYADLLEVLRAYLCTGTSSVGECAQLIESELT
jgi:hypothetical protein